MIDRESELERLLSLALGRHISRLEAPRRYGKTSLLGRVLADADGEGLVTTRVDFEDVLSLGAVVTRIERAYSRSLREPIRTRVQRLLNAWNLGVSLGGGGFGVHLKANPKLDAETVLLRLLELPEHLHQRDAVRCLIVFDEVGDLHEVKGAAGIIRSVIQHHLDAASYIFAGSAPTLMRRLFDEPDAPFLQQGVGVRLDPLPSNDLHDFIHARFADTDRDPGDALGELLTFARGHPQRAMMLAHHLWTITSAGKRGGLEDWLLAREAALAESDLALKARWSGLPGTERRAAAALALAPDEPGGKGVLGLVGLSQDSVYSALDSLEGRGEVIVAGGKRRLVDPLLELWLNEREGSTG